MKKTTLLLFGFLLFSICFLSAQSILGTWTMEGTNPEGESVTHTLIFGEEGMMTVDFGSDGNIEFTSNYTVDGNQVSFSDMSEESPCYGKVGVYEFSIEGNIMSAKAIDDLCDERRGDGELGTMTRAE